MNEKKLLLLSSSFTTSFIISNILANKIISINHREFTASVLIYPITFLLSNIITDKFGKSISSSVVKNTFIIQIIVLIISSLVILIPSNELITSSTAFDILFTSNIRIVIGGCFAFFISQKVNIYLFDKLKNNNNNFLLNLILSNSISLLFDVSIFISISFLGIIILKDLINLILNIYLIQLFISIILILCFNLYKKRIN